MKEKQEPSHQGLHENEKLVGLHSPIWIEESELERLKGEVQLMSMMIATGIVSQPNGLETLAIKILFANGHIGKDLDQ